MPFYVVGESTASALRATLAAYDDLGLEPPDVRGQGSGNAAALGAFIVDDVKDRPVKLLYLTGDKNRDTLPSILADGGLSLLSVQVYMTQGSSTFGTTLDSRLKEADDGILTSSGRFPTSADAMQIIGGLFTLRRRRRILQHPFFKKDSVKMGRRKGFYGHIGLLR